MGSQVTTVIGFLPGNFQLPMPFHSRLMVKHGTDGQTMDGLMPAQSTVTSDVL